LIKRPGADIQKLIIPLKFSGQKATAESRHILPLNGDLEPPLGADGKSPAPQSLRFFENENEDDDEDDSIGATVGLATEPPRRREKKF
jgi:hypothetical protein